MADKKISNLTAATIPLAGTEVLPIVQSNTTKKVSVDNLTEGKLVKVSRLNAGTGTFDVNAPIHAIGGSIWSSNFYEIGRFQKSSGVGVSLGYDNSAYVAAIGAYSHDGTASSLSFWTYPGVGAAVESARVDGSTGNFTVNTGNLVVGTAGKGIDFSANTHAAGMTSELLDWYEEGTWTPVVTPFTGAITSYTASGNYTRIGRQVTVNMNIAITTNGTGASALMITGVPFSAATTRFDAGTGREYVSTGKAVALTFSATDTLQMLNYDNTYPGGDGYQFAASITYNV